MGDVIWGDVYNVVDGDTFDMEVTGRALSNEYDYNENERIRLAGLDAPELDTREGKRSKRFLAKAIDGRHVRVDVKARDHYRRVVGDVTVED